MSFGSRVPYARKVRPSRPGPERVGDAGAGRARDDVPGRTGCSSSPRTSAPSPSRTTKISSSAEWQCGGAPSLPGGPSTCFRPVGPSRPRVPRSRRSRRPWRRRGAGRDGVDVHDRGRPRRRARGARAAPARASPSHGEGSPPERRPARRRATRAGARQVARRRRARAGRTRARRGRRARMQRVRPRRVARWTRQSAGADRVGGRRPAPSSCQESPDAAEHPEDLLLCRARCARASTTRPARSGSAAGRRVTCPPPSRGRATSRRGGRRCAGPFDVVPVDRGGHPPA